MNKKVTGIFLLLTVNIVAIMIAPAFTKNFNLPEGVNRIYKSGGDAIVATPEGFPIPSLRILAVNLEAGAHGPGESIVLQMQIPSGAWIPIAHITTIADSIPFLSVMWSGLPAANNIISVLDSELDVDRHGNRITVNLNAPKVISLMFGDVTIPAFTMELNKVGGSIHTEYSIPLIGYPGASGYTIEVEMMGFNAEGAFTCEAWDYAEEQMTEEVITMHGIETFIPPPT